MNEMWMLTLNFLGFWAAVAFVTWVVAGSRRKSRTTQALTEFHNRLLDKIGSARDFSDFLQSDGGNRFLESMSLERTDPNQRILGSIQTGAVLTMLGAGLLLCGVTLQTESDVCLFLGTISASLGVGFLVSSAVAYRLSKTWGLINGAGTRGAGGPAVPSGPADAAGTR